jgi:uncharacterized C2H2 Zn-finger protein
MPKATVRKFKCSRCDRTFSMAAHLARHQNTMHATKARKKKRAKRAVRKMVRRVGARAKRTRRVAAGGPPPLLRQMHTYRDSLVAEQSRVTEQINAIDRALAALGTPARAPAVKPGPRRRAGRVRRGSLKYYVERVLHAGSGPMAVKDVTIGVRKAGFKSKNKTLAKSVGIAMSQMRNVAKVSRGVFRLK